VHVQTVVVGFCELLVEGWVCRLATTLRCVHSSNAHFHVLTCLQVTNSLCCSAPIHCALMEASADFLQSSIYIFSIYIHNHKRYWKERLRGPQKGRPPLFAGSPLPWCSHIPCCGKYPVPMHFLEVLIFTRCLYRFYCAPSITTLRIRPCSRSEQPRAFCEALTVLIVVCWLESAVFKPAVCASEGSAETYERSGRFFHVGMYTFPVRFFDRCRWYTNTATPSAYEGDRPRSD